VAGTRIVVIELCTSEHYLLFKYTSAKLLNANNAILQAVIVFSTLSTGRLPVQSKNLSCYVEGSKASIPDREIDDYSIEFDYEDGGLPLCQVMLPRPSSPTGCIDAVFITEEDLEGYDMHIDTGKDVVSLEVVASRKPIMRRLSCLFGSLKLTSNCEPAPSRFTEVRAC
jgi:atypical dual specificity phosphatase